MSAPDFAAYFAAVHGVPPLPWQQRLAAHLAAGGEWPERIELPPASGKTACLDLALFHLACWAARGEPWRAARRIVVLVDRHLVVDAAFEHADTIRRALEDSSTPAVVAMATALRALGGEHPLLCRRIGGGMSRERGFALDPAQPMVITSTLDQIGSRLLFRGQGMSPYSWPLHAGLLGHDTLLLLDEVQRSAPFVETVAAIRREQARAEQPLSPLRPLHLVCLGASADAPGHAFRLDAQDRGHPLFVERHRAPKPARLLEARAAERLKALHDETVRLHAALGIEAPAIAVVVNRVRTARALFEALRKTLRGGAVDVRLMIGRSRPLDRDRVARAVQARVAAGGPAAAGARGLIVVATQSLEVGTDLDFHGLVSECAPLDALRQRVGRLDRLGRFRRAQAVIVGGGEPTADPLYGPALSATWQWLNAIAAEAPAARIVDLSTAALEAALERVDRQPLSAPPRPGLPLTPAHVRLLCQTSPRPAYDPDLGVLLHGFGGEQDDLQVVWRAGLPDSAEAALVGRLLELVPPSSLEAIGLPLAELHAWLAEAGGTDLADLEGVTAAPAPPGCATERKVWRRGDDGWEWIGAPQLRAGDTIVVPAAYGGCDVHGYAPYSRECVADLSAAAREALGRERIVLVTEEVVAALPLDDGIDRARAWQQTQAACRAEPPAGELLGVLLEALAATPADLGWPESGLVERLLRADGELYALVVRSGVAGDDDLSDEDLSSSRTRPVPLAAHNAAVGRRAAALAAAVGLPPPLRAALERAGALHDIGKADPRFQRLLHGAAVPHDAVLLAKGRRGVASVATESRERHEAYSVALLMRHPHLLRAVDDADLATYLIGAHHGRGRAWMPDCADEGTAFRLDLDGEALAFDGAPRLGALETGWPGLFWRLNRRYGAWGLAYLEAVLRLADHLQSRHELTKETS